MDANLITGMSGVLGSLVGGSATLATAWITQKTTTKRELVQLEIRKRESLYGEFITECSKLLLDAMIHGLDKPETVLPAYALLNRIRLCATPVVLREAEELLRRIADQYFDKNLSVEELRAVAHSANADPLKRFGEACREEFVRLNARL
jgi:hypothetical protein